MVTVFLSTPSARRATDAIERRLQGLEISIHALREEGDAGAGDLGGVESLFLSTPSARRATPEVYARRVRDRISIHALREEGDRGTRARVAGIVDFYPRPPRGGRPHDLAGLREVGVFLSTPSARRATSS